MGQKKISGASTAALALATLLSTSCVGIAEHAEDGSKEPTEATNPYLESLQRSTENAQQAPDPTEGNISTPFVPQYIPEDNPEIGIDSTFIQELKRAIEEAEKAPEPVEGIVPTVPRLDEYEGPG